MIKKRLKWHLVLALLPIISLTLILAGCDWLAPKTQSISASFIIHPKDAAIKQLLALTRQLNIEASGELQGGNFQVSGKQVSIKSGTTFKFSLSMPIENPDSINTSDAYSQLWTSQPVQVCGIALPKNLTLSNGKVIGELDLARMFTGLLINVLQDQESSRQQSEDLKAMIKSLKVEKTELQFRANSTFETASEKLHIGNQSRMELSNLNFDSESNFSGICLLKLNFLPDCHWIGKKVSCTFEGGTAQLTLNVKRMNHIVSCAIADPHLQSTNLSNCHFYFGKDNSSSAYCQNSYIYPQVLTWQKEEGQDYSVLHLSAAMNLFKPILKIKTANHLTSANFSDIVQSVIKIDKTQQQQQTEFTTKGVDIASSATINIFRPTSTLELDLAKTKIGPFSLNKSGQLALSFDQGTAKLKRLRWTSRKKYFELIPSGSSDISIPQGMSIFTDEDSKFHMILPITIKLATAQMNSSSGLFQLTSINGKILVNIDKELSLNGDGIFNLSNSTFLGSQQLAIKVQGFNLLAEKNQIIAKLSGCSLTISNTSLQNAIQGQIPQDKTFNLNKTILDKQHWRYKNAEINTVALHKLALNKLFVNSANSAQFIVGGKAAVDGTIDKGSLMSIIKKTDKYQSKPWHIDATCIGNGLIKFSFVPGANLADSKFIYDLDAALPIPNDVSLDWSQVTKGFAGGLERGVIVSVLKNLQPIPIKYHGDKKLFASTGNRLASIKVDKISTKQVPDGVELSFVANGVF